MRMKDDDDDDEPRGGRRQPVMRREYATIPVIPARANRDRGQVAWLKR